MRKAASELQFDVDVGGQGKEVRRERPRHLDPAWNRGAASHQRSRKPPPTVSQTADISLAYRGTARRAQGDHKVPLRVCDGWCP